MFCGWSIASIIPHSFLNDLRQNICLSNWPWKGFNFSIEEILYHLDKDTDFALRS